MNVNSDRNFQRIAVTHSQHLREEEAGCREENMLARRDARCEDTNYACKQAVVLILHTTQSLSPLPGGAEADVHARPVCGVVHMRVPNFGCIFSFE